jgi:O-antigen/teichoic acid export membrane protein
MSSPDMKKSKALLQVIFEQAAFTLSFFSTQALLARYLSVEVFASFSAIYSAVILLNIVHGCIVMEPLLVFAKSDYSIGRKLLLKLHLPMALLSILVVIYLALRMPDTPQYFVYGLILALAGFVAYWTVRAIAILENKSLKSLIPALAQLAGVYAAITLLPKDSPYQLSELLAAIGLPLLLASGLVAAMSRKKGGYPNPVPGEKTAWLRFGLNNSLSQIMVWAMTHGLVIYYMSRQQADLAANFRVVMTLVLPAQYLNIAISNFGLPRLARLADEKSAKFSTMARMLIMATLISSLVYSLMLWLSGQLLVGLLFGDKYSGLDMRDYFLLPMILAAIQGTRTVLKALKLTHYASWAVAGGFLCFMLVFVARPATSVSTVFIPTIFGLGLAAFIMFYQIRKRLKVVAL